MIPPVKLTYTQYMMLRRLDRESVILSYSVKLPTAKVLVKLGLAKWVKNDRLGWCDLGITGEGRDRLRTEPAR